MLPNPIAAASEAASRLGSPQSILSYLAALDLSDPISVPRKPSPSHPSPSFRACNFLLSLLQHLTR